MPLPLTPIVTWRPLGTRRVHLSRDTSRSVWHAASGGRFAIGDSIEEAVDAINGVSTTRR